MKKLIVITGASSGFGKATAIQWFCRKLSAWLRYFQNQLSLDTIILL